METVLKKRISPNDMSKLFDLVNIRYYNALNPIISMDLPVQYEIKLRHDENTQAIDIINEALKKK